MNIAVIYGGRSGEHEISLISAAAITRAIKKENKVILIGITKDGRWYLQPDAEYQRICNDEKAPLTITEDEAKLVSVIPGAKKDAFSAGGKSLNIDVVFPALHGTYGEDGTIQGLFEMAHIPYVGCGHLSSAITMDKFFTKVIADSIGVEQAAYIGVRSYETKDEYIEETVKKVEAARQYPMFVKPSCAGSSMGITKAHNRDELISGLKLAAQHDSKILVEETINGREIECAVFGYGDNTFATGVGEIVAAAEFYDFDAKYNNEDSLTVVDPDVPEDKREEIRRKAVEIFKACDGFGFSRVDFFLEKDTDRVVFNEINTIPGHTAISMYPMLMNSAGHSMKEYVEELIQMSSQRHV